MKSAICIFSCLLPVISCAQDVSNSAEDAPWRTSSSCDHPKYEGWTDLCVTIEAKHKNVHEEGEVFRVKLSVENDGNIVAGDVTADLQIFSVGNEIVEFGSIAPGDTTELELVFTAKYHQIVFMRLQLHQDNKCDERGKISFPPIEIPGRVGLCKNEFEEAMSDE